MVVGLLYGVRQVTSHQGEDYERETRDELSEGEGTLGRPFHCFAVLGAALSPDLSASAVFAVSSVLALLSFLLLGSAGLAKALERMPPKYNDAPVGFVIASVGAYILVVG